MRQFCVVIVVVLLSLLVLGMCAYLTYELGFKHHNTLLLLHPSIIPVPQTPIVRVRVSENVDRIAVLQSAGPHHSALHQYCEKYGLDYLVLSTPTSSDPWAHLFYLLLSDAKKYAYVALLDPSVHWTAQSGKPLHRLIQQSGDNDLIMCRSSVLGQCNQVDTKVLIFKNTEWSQYKCIQLYINSVGVQTLLLDPVYTKYKHMSLLEAKERVDMGLPYMLQSLCVYNEKAFELNHSITNMYPWCGVEGFVEVPRKPLPNAPMFSGDQKIPKVIYQTMNSTLVNVDRYKFSVQAWQKLNPEYEYYYFDALDARKFVETHFDKQVGDAYDILLPGAFKADLFRLCLLYVYGGCYVDSQTQPFIPLREIIEADSEFVSARDVADYGILQAFLCTVPKHPVLKRAIDQIVSNVFQRKHFSCVLAFTGPTLLGRCLNKWLGRPKKQSVKYGLPSTIKLLDSDYSDSFSRYQKNDKFYIYNGDDKFLLMKYIYDKQQLSKSLVSIDNLTGKEHYKDAHSKKLVYKPRLLYN